MVSNISSILSPAKILKNFSSRTQNVDNLRFALFFALMNTVYKMILCIMRRFVKSDKVNSLVAGFIAGLVSRVDIKKRRSFLLILLLSRFFDISYTMAESRGVASRITHGELLIWVLCSVFQQYGMGMETNVLNQG